jgi:hypothetical protein
MTHDQDKIIADLTEWADSRGNWVFVRDLGIYYEFLKLREIGEEKSGIQKPVKPVQGQEGEQEDAYGSTG